MVASVHRRVVGQRGFGSSATQLMRAVSLLGSQRWNSLDHRDNSGLSKDNRMAAWVRNHRNTTIGAGLMVLAALLLVVFLRDIQDGVAFVASPPPKAIIEVDGHEYAGAIGSYCWAGLCADTVGTPTSQDIIRLSRHAMVEVRLPINADPTGLGANIHRVTDRDALPTSASGYRWWNVSGGATIASLPVRRQLLGLSVESGTYVLSIVASWNGRGDCLYGFLIEVE